jgi:hypothetical protein
VGFLWSKALLPIRPESHSAAKWNFFKTHFKTVFGWKSWKKNQKFLGFCFFCKLRVLSFLKNFYSCSKKISKFRSETVLKSFLKKSQNRWKIAR